MLTAHVKACARADGSKPAPPDEFTLAFVGDRCIGRFDVTTSDGQTIADTLEKFTRPPAANDDTTLAQRQAEGLVRICEIALARGTDAPGARPVVSYLTHERTPGDATHPLTLGLFAGVIDPRERDRILCDATIVRVGTDTDGTHSVSDAPRRYGIRPNGGQSPPAARTVSGRVVRSPARGATSTTSSTGNTADAPTSPTVPTCVEDTTRSCTNIAAGPSPSNDNGSACTEPTAPKSTPTPGTASPRDAVRPEWEDRIRG